MYCPVLVLQYSEHVSKLMLHIAQTKAVLLNKDSTAINVDVLP